MKKRFLRAFTLVEMVITIGLVALISSLVISFVVYMDKAQVRNVEYDSFLSQLEDVRSEIDFFVTAGDERNSTFTLRDDGMSIQKESGEIYTLFCFDGYFSTNYADSRFKQGVEMDLDRIQRIAFSFAGDSNKPTVSEDEKLFSFLVELRVKNTVLYCDIVYKKI